MKQSGCNRRYRGGKTGAALFIILASFMVFGASIALGAGGEGGPKGWVNTDTYRVMNFLVLAVALFFILKKPVSQALGGRIQGIKDQLEDLESRKKDAEAQLAKYNEKLSLLDQEAEKIVTDYVRQGEEAKARILKEAQSAAEKLEIQAAKNIEHTFAQARANLQAEVIEKALAKAEEVIKSKISDEDQDRLVEEYLDKVVA